jgi:hypothetical protein
MLGCNEPWTPEHKFSCNFRRAVNAMNLTPKDRLAIEQKMEEENHVLLQIDTPEAPADPYPQLLMLSSIAASGIQSAATFSVLIQIGGRKGVALVDSGSTDSFIDYTFASKTNYIILSTTSLKVKVAGGGYLDTCAITTPTSYTIQQQGFSG